MRVQFGCVILDRNMAWLFESDDNVILAALPSNYSRSSTLTRGGRLAFVHKKALSGIKLVPCDPASSFEVMGLVVHEITGHSFSHCLQTLSSGH